MSILIILNREPYDDTDVTWNALRLAGTLVDQHQDVRLFLMNDSVDLARDVCRPPEGYDQDLSAMPEGPDRARRDGAGLRHLHGALRHLQESPLF